MSLLFKKIPPLVAVLRYKISFIQDKEGLSVFLRHLNSIFLALFFKSFKKNLKRSRESMHLLIISSEFVLLISVQTRHKRLSYRYIWVSIATWVATSTEEEIT